MDYKGELAMARFYYSETYTEVDMQQGNKREFKREFGIDGSKDEIKEVLSIAFAQLPRYNYPVLESRKKVLENLYLAE